MVEVKGGQKEKIGVKKWRIGLATLSWTNFRELGPLF